MVRSALKSVSNTLSKPRRRRDAAILPSTLVPIGRPKASPRAARTAGAVCTSTCLEGSASAANTSSVKSFSRNAPVGHTAIHWPQDTQLVSPKPISNAEPMLVTKPRSLAPITPIPCTFAQTATQRRQRIHLLLSRIMWAAESSISKSCISPSYMSSFSTFRSLQSF